MTWHDHIDGGNLCLDMETSGGRIQMLQFALRRARGGRFSKGSENRPPEVRRWMEALAGGAVGQCSMLMGRVARMYYDHGFTHQEIADALGLSRVRVTRLLAEARANGMVQIVVNASDSVFAEEERQLGQRFGLGKVFLSPNVRDVEKTAQSFAMLGAAALESLVGQNSVVAVGFSREIAHVAAEFSAERPGARFVPVAGSTAGLSAGVNPHELALRLAERSGGRAFHLPAPLLASSPESGRAIRHDPHVQEVLVRAAEAHILVVGLGAAQPGMGMLFDLLSADEAALLVDEGAVGDFGGRFFDSAGSAIDGDLSDRLVGLSLDDLVGIPVRVAFVRGAAKLAPLRIALKRGMINTLISDIDTARALLR